MGAPHSAQGPAGRTPCMAGQPQPMGVTGHCRACGRETPVSLSGTLATEAHIRGSEENRGKKIQLEGAACPQLGHVPSVKQVTKPETEHRAHVLPPLPAGGRGEHSPDRSAARWWGQVPRPGTPRSRFPRAVQSPENTGSCGPGPGRAPSSKSPIETGKRPQLSSAAATS